MVLRGISKSLVRAMVLISGFSSRKKLLVSRREMLEKDCWNWLCRSQKIFAFLHLTVCFQIKIFCPREDLAILSHCPYKGSFQEGKNRFVDKHFQPFSEQWTYLQQVQKIGQKKILDFLGQEFSDTVDDTVLDCSLSNVIRVEKRAISSKQITY